MADDKGGVRQLPVTNQSAFYSLTISDVGKVISISAGNVAIPNAVFSGGDTISIYNNSSANQVITSNSSVTTYFVGTATTGTRTLAQRGLATLVCVSANTFVITGGGLS
jgi:hypothetical protein